jgi:hypothetical protein
MLAFKSVAVSAVVIGLLASAGPSTRAETQPMMGIVGAARESAPAVDGACTFECYVEICPAYAHQVDPGGSKDATGPEHNCGVTGSTCMSRHGCGISAIPQGTDLLRLIADEDFVALRLVIPDRNLVYVPERGVLQIVADCGTTVSQLPLNVRAAVALDLH